MIYRFFVRYHIVTALLGVMIIFFGAGSSDFYVEQGLKEPKGVGTLLTWGTLCMIPTVIYSLLEYFKRKKKEGQGYEAFKPV